MAKITDILIYQGPPGPPGSGSGASVAVQPGAPASPATGALWFDTDDPAVVTPVPSAPGQVVTGGVAGAPTAVPFYVNVRAWAKADGVTDDVTNITNADTAARATKATLYFPPGTYLTSKLTPQTGSRWLLHRDAILKLNPAANTTAVIEFRSGVNDIIIDGGTLLGTWVKATYDGTLTSGQVVGQYGLKYETGAAGTDLSAITVRRMQIKSTASYAIFGAPTNGTEWHHLTLEDIDAITCWGGPSLTGGGTTVATGLTHHVTVRRCTVDGTWTPPAGTKNASYGGNALTFGGIIDDLTVEDCRVDQAGRMAVEIAPTAYDTYGRLPLRMRLRRNTFANGMYRTVSVNGDDMHIVDNTIIEINDWIEINGRQVRFAGNSCYNGGLFALGSNPPAFPKAYYVFAYWTVVDNTFINCASATGALTFQLINAPVIARNTIRIDSQIPAGGGFTATAIISIRNCTRPIVEHNRIIHTAPVLERTLWQFSNNVDGSFSGNTVELDSATTSALTYGASAGSSPTLVILTAPIGCVIARNELTAQSAFSVGEAVIFPWHAVPTTATRRVFTSATAFTDTALTSPTPLNTPPGSPATSSLYLVGSTPTGAWASNPESVATWSGSAWTFQAIKDIFGIPSSAYFGGEATAPLVATSGDVYLLIDNTPVRNVVEDNRIDRRGKLTVSAAPMVMDAGAHTALSWRNRFTNNSFVPADWQDMVFIAGDVVQDRGGDPSDGANDTAVTRLPPATLGRRGWTYQVQSAAGTADRFVICAKDATNAYAWKDLY